MRRKPKSLNRVGNQYLNRPKMGQFASIISLTLDEILTLAESQVTDKVAAVSDLTLIIKSLTPRVPAILPPPILPPGELPLAEAIGDALTAATKETNYIFGAIYPAVILPPGNTDYGVVLNYAPTPGNTKTLASHLASFFAHYNLQISLAHQIAEQLQPQVIASGNTPSVTYGRIATSKISISDPIITIDYLFWVAAFGVYRTGVKNQDGSPNCAIIYSFSAATGPLQSIMQ